MRQTEAQKAEILFNLAGDDAILPFAVETLNLRGRAVQLGAALDKLIKRHNYPEPVAALLAEAVVLTALLGSSLKFQGKFTLQAQTDGAVNLLICDYIAPAKAGEPASVRAYARFNAEKLAQAEAENGKSPNGGGAAADKTGTLLGNGTLALTLDQGAHMQLYQGIVELRGGSLEEAAHRYFAQSEQIPTKIRLSSALLTTRAADGAAETMRRGGGILAQYLPQGHGDTNSAGAHTEKAENEPQSAESAEDKWREAEVLMATVEDAELTDPQVPSEQLLYRLFHQQGARVFAPQPIIEKCSCSRAKLFAILADFSAKEQRESLGEDGKIHAKCEFCSAEYIFSPDEFSAPREMLREEKTAETADIKAE